MPFMSSHSTQTNASTPSIEGWHELERLFQRLQALASEDTTPSAYYTRLLEVLVEELDASGGVVWRRVGPGSVEAVCQLHPEKVGLIDDLASQRFHLFMVEEAARTRRSLVAAPRSSVQGQVNDSSQGLVFAPVDDAGRIEFVVQLFRSDAAEQDALQGLGSILEAVAGLATEYHRVARTRELAARVATFDALDEFALRVHARLGLESTSLTIVNETARLWGADRVSLLLKEGPRCRLVAVSGVIAVERRSGAARALEQLAEIATVTGELRYPSAGELPPQVETAAQAFVDSHDATRFDALLLREPIEHEGDRESPPLGVLVIEHFHEPTADVSAALRQSLVRHSASALANALVCRRWTWFRWVSSWWGEAPLRRHRPVKWRAVAMGLLAAALIIVGAWPVDFAITSPGRLLPANRQDVFAPSAGIVAKLLVEEGTEIGEQQPLAELASPALELQLSEVLGKRQATEAAIAAARAFRLAEGSSAGSGNEAGRYAAQEEELNATLAGLQAQYEILLEQRRQLMVRSPMAGQILTRDVSRRLTGRPVVAGDLLFRVADLDGPWQLDLDLPEHRVSHVLQAQLRESPLPVRFIISTSPARSYNATLNQLTNVVQVDSQGQTYVPVHADVGDLADLPKRPGATVQARITCGRKPLAYVWFHDVWEALEVYWWQ
jgi:multidrug efflux pump subunit AcrA (membrane-fusion protein)